MNISRNRLLALSLGLLPACALAVPEGPGYPSTAWTLREVQNYAKLLEAPLEQARNPAFVLRLTTQSVTNGTGLVVRDLADPSWLLVSSPPLNQVLGGLAYPVKLVKIVKDALAGVLANPPSAISVPLDTPLTPLCASYALQCAGDPFRYPATDSFYRDQAVVTPVVFYDSGCARLSGRIWRPKSIASGTRLPGVVIENGSIQAPETAYWWMAQRLVRAGYVVLSFDPRGQGRSDFETPNGQQGTNLNPSVFWLGLVDAIDFFRSSATRPYPNNAACMGRYPTRVAPFNPAASFIDAARLGIAGHSLGAIGVSVVQGYGGVGADPWPGKLDRANPVKVAVAWDGLAAPGRATGSIGGVAGNILSRLPALLDPIARLVFERDIPQFAARVPAMGQSSEYGIAPTPFLSPPKPDSHKVAYEAWRAAGVPTFELTIRGSTHFEWSLLPTFPTTSWCPKTVDGHCTEGFGNPLAQHYTLAWLDRWLKQPGEAGYADADARLLDDDGPQGRDKFSFYYRSARSFPDRGGQPQVCADIRGGC